MELCLGRYYHYQSYSFHSLLNYLAWIQKSEVHSSPLDLPKKQDLSLEQFVLEGGFLPVVQLFVPEIEGFLYLRVLKYEIPETVFRDLQEASEWILVFEHLGIS